MGLLSIFERNDSASATSPAAAESGDDVQRLRTRSRQRLIGAAVLIAAGVIGFPLVFETQPRPIAVDIPIEIARKDQVPPLVMPLARAALPAASSVPPAIDDAARDAAASATRAPAPPASAPVAKTPASPNAAPAPRVNPAKPAPAAAPAPAKDGARARALLEGKEAKKKDEILAASKKKDQAVASRQKDEAVASKQKDEPVAAVSGRFVVQVGAFSEEAAAREMSQKVERLGLKTHTQKVATPSGSRIRVRVGPFTSRDEADQVAVKIKSAGLSSAVLSL